MPNDSPSLELRRVLFSNVARDISSKHLGPHLVLCWVYTNLFFYPQGGGRALPAHFVSDVDHGLTQKRIDCDSRYLKLWSDETALTCA